MESQIIQLLQNPNAMQDGSLQKAIQDVMASQVLSDMCRVVELLCEEKVGFSVSKEAMKLAAASVDQFSDLKAMGVFVSKIIQCTLPRQSAYEETITMTREKAAAKYEASGLKKEAAEELACLYEYKNESLDARTASKNVDFVRGCVNLCVHAAKLLTEINDFAGASRLLIRASDKISDLPAGDRAALDYKLLNTKLFDLRHDFIRAAQRYVELFRQPALSHEERMHCLLCCAQNAILAEAGPERASVIAILFKDERTSSLAIYPFIKKVHFQQILRHDDIVAIQDLLQEHQKVLLAGEKMSPLARAVMLHNLFSAANIYTSIHLRELGELLGIPEEEAENVAADMIRQRRIDAKIDQIDGFLHFNNRQDPLTAWDKHIDYMCTTADEASDMIKRCGDML